MLILRLLFVVVLIAVIAVFAMGYLSNRSDQAISLPDRAQAADSVARARDGAAELGEKAGVAASTVGATLEEAATTTKIKAKMALDDLVKASTISVETTGSVVTLTGRVSSTAERDRAVRLAQETDGVTKVVDKLQIVR
jgi:hyperosmotically inducible protein